MPTPSALIVTNHFGAYKRGDRINDSVAIAKILASSNRANVVAVKAAPLTPPTPDLAPTGESTSAKFAS